MTRLFEKLNSATPEKLNILLASMTAPGSSPAFYEKALRLEHNVVTFGPFRDHDFWRAQAEQLKQHAFYRDGAAEYWADTFSRLAKPCDIVTSRGLIDLRELRRELPAGFEPDLLVWVDQYEWNLPTHFEAFKCPKVALFGDTHIHRRHPDKWVTWIEYARLYDYVFMTFNASHRRLFSEAGCPRVFWSPAAFDPDVHKKLDVEKSYSVSFIGSTYRPFHTDRILLLDELRKSGVDVYIDTKALQDMSMIFSRSKIVFNRSMADDVNMRVFEALGTGSLLCTNRLGPESCLEQMFKDREHLVLYEDSNLIEVVRHYLTDDSERERIASNGYAEAQRKHTYRHRVEEILQTIKQHPLV